MPVTVTRWVTVDNVVFNSLLCIFQLRILSTELTMPVMLDWTSSHDRDRGWCHLQRTLLFIHPFFLPSFCVWQSEQHFQRDEVVNIKHLFHSPNSANNLETSAGTAGLGGHGVGPPTLDLLFLCCGLASWNPYLSGLMLACLVKLNCEFLWQYFELKHPLSAKSKQLQVPREVRVGEILSMSWYKKF